MQQVLLILPSLFISYDRVRFESSIRERINLLTVKRLEYYNPFYILDVDDIVEAAYQLQNLSGIVKISIVQESVSDLGSILDEAIDVSKKIFSSDQTFFIEVYYYNKNALTFLEKDLQVSVTSAILSLNSYSLKPSPKDKADKVIEIYVSDDNSFLSLHSLSSNGGLPCKSYDKRSVCAIYDSLSALSAYLAIKSGMDLEIIVFYYDQQSLKKNLMHIENILNKISFRLDIRIIKYNHNFNKQMMRYVFEILSIRVMLKIKADEIVSSLNTAFHSFGFVKKELGYIIQNGKIPFLPLMMLNDDLFDIATKNGFDIRDLIHEQFSSVEFQEDFVRLEDNIEKSSIGIYDTSKIFHLQKGFNSLHDILNSI